MSGLACPEACVGRRHTTQVDVARTSVCPVPSFPARLFGKLVRRRGVDFAKRCVQEDGDEVRPDWESSILAVAAETYVLQVSDANRGVSDERRISWAIDFTEEPYAEPNDTPAQAVASELGEEIALRLMPRADLEDDAGSMLLWVFVVGLLIMAAIGFAVLRRRQA